MTPLVSSERSSQWRSGLLLAVVLAGLVTALHWAYSTVYTGLDLGWQWLATRYWLQGVDPYSAEMTFLLRPNVTDEHASGFPYPFAVILFTLPFAALPLPWASTVWGLVSLAAITALPWVVAERPTMLAAGLPFVYFPFWAAMEQAQWAPMMLAFVLLSLRWHRTGRMRLAGGVLPLLLLKPQLGLPIGAAVLAYQWMRGLDRRWLEGVVLGCLLIWGTSLLVAPGWPIAWLRQLQYYSDEGLNSVKMYSITGAVVLALSLLLTFVAWRRGDAALVMLGVLLLGLLVLPMRSFYNQTLLLLPLAFLAARRPRAAFAVALASWVLFVLVFSGLDTDNAAVIALYAPPLLVGLLELRWPAARAHADQVQ
jgi:hypothetical protein